ncbi:TraR/DksA family transcriptional regulator [Ralstonia solanacearum]|uniref:TraR/DksA family transcriptional regulator n=1 Tax=Ralstonia solanacearum TaxID=305 RepID=UPI0018660469|nr:TraR/DksA family transcriptional regulator [Ralstonia solanacearum]QOK83975.1 TraR/DksA family transcriptional regulator [Ralstonia solanacearum]
MPHLTEMQWTRLRALLDEQDARIRRQLENLGASNTDGPQEGPLDEADLADQEMAGQTSGIMLNHYREELAKVEAARERMAQGQYGGCMDCGKPIPFLRLQAQPVAKRCLACQASRERRLA